MGLDEARWFVSGAGFSSSRSVTQCCNQVSSGAPTLPNGESQRRFFTALRSVSAMGANQCPGNAERGRWPAGSASDTTRKGSPVM